MTTGPRVAIAPVQRPAVAAAVRSAGAAVVPLESAAVLVWDGKADRDLVHAVRSGPQLEWVHVWPAGADRVFSSGAFTPRLAWTTSKSAYGRPVAECALMLLLAVRRDLPRFLADSRDRAQTGRTLFGRQVTIVGAGAIATCLVSLLAPFEVRISVVRHSPTPFPGVDGTYLFADLAAIVGTTDALVLASPLTRETRGLVDMRVLNAMNSAAWLINVGRGGLLDHDALATALANGVIAGACLDVTEPEPLPAGHPLRAFDNCVLTPHVGNTWEMSEQAFADRVAENLRRFTGGAPLLGLVTEADRPG